MEPHTRTWKIENETQGGQALIVDEKGLEWVKYALPVTKYSGGGSPKYTLEEGLPGNKIHEEIREIFGEKTAQTIAGFIRELLILQYPPDKPLPASLAFSENKKETTSFFASIPENQVLPKNTPFHPWPELTSEYLQRFGWIAELRVNGVFLLIEKQSGNTLLEFKGNKIAALNFPFHYTLVIAGENTLKIISGASGTKKTMEPLVAIEELNELLLFPPHPFENSILLPEKINRKKNGFCTSTSMG
jgi:hypothetical protein